MKRFKDLLNQNAPVLGLYITSPDPSVVEKAKRAGIDFVRIDQEHALLDYSEIAQLIRTATLLEMPAHVRVSNLHDVTRLLDFGAAGIVVPGVNTVEQAKEAVQVAKFSPLGSRGMFPPGRCVEMVGYNFNEYVREANELVSLTVQIEDVKAMDYMDEIVSLEGVDFISSGKADISQSVGVPGQFNHPKVLEMEDFIIKKALAAGKQPIVMAGNKRRIEDLHALGVKAFMIGIDDEIIFKAFRNTVNELKGVRPTNIVNPNSYGM